VASAELYDPASGTWSRTGGLPVSVYDHAATLLPNGAVLMTGGVHDGLTTDAEIYDPRSGAWTVTGSLNVARSRHTSILLRKGKVLIVAGVTTNEEAGSTELGLRVRQ
jgi:N-acetylneuraminic acid mutarotase